MNLIKKQGDFIKNYYKDNPVILKRINELESKWGDRFIFVFTNRDWLAKLKYPDILMPNSTLSQTFVHTTNNLQFEKWYGNPQPLATKEYLLSIRASSTTRTWLTNIGIFVGIADGFELNGINNIAGNQFGHCFFTTDLCSHWHTFKNILEESIYQDTGNNPQINHTAVTDTLGMREYNNQIQIKWNTGNWIQPTPNFQDSSTLNWGPNRYFVMIFMGHGISLTDNMQLVVEL